MKITDIPSMGAQAVGADLREYAKQVSGEKAIAELGVWLGAGTAYLAEGAKVSGSHVHAYDRFDARKSQRKKASKLGWKIKGDTLPLVQSSIDALGLSEYVTLHKCSICSEEWTYGPIGVFVLDTCKGFESFSRVIDMYAPYFVPGETVVVLMDFWYSVRDSEKKSHMNQYNWIEERRDSFRDIQFEMADHSSASFLYLGGDLC